jgi:NTP pyrophosphatase (non-canonical NTP hydrolase)
MTITELVDICYKAACDKGWGEKPVPVTEQVALIHSEASEALEAYRNHEPVSWIDKDGKPQGIASEYADILIRVGHYSKLLKIDLEAEVQRKLAYNATRPHRHGGKEC